MSKFTIFMIIILLGVLAVFAIFNNELTQVTVPFDNTYHIPKVALILACFVFGAVSMLMIFIVRDTKRFVSSYQEQRQMKKAEKVESIYSKALNAILAEKEVEARTNLSEVLKMDPAHVEALLRTGDLDASRKQYDKAAESYRKVLAHEPGNLEALFGLEKMMSALRKPKEGLAFIEKVLERDSGNLYALNRKRAIIEKENRWGEVIEIQKTILKQMRGDTEKKAEEARLLGYRYEESRDSLENGDIEKAAKGFRAILKESPNFIPAHLGLAECMLVEDRNEEAVTSLEKAFESTGSQIILARLEDMLISLGDPLRLIRTYKNAVATRPGNTLLKFFLAKLYYRLEMIDEAFDTLESVELSEAFTEFYRLKGELYLRRSQCSEAVEQFKKTLELGKTLKVPYCCSACGYSAEEWSGRCINCGSWNTSKFDLHGPCKV